MQLNEKHGMQGCWKANACFSFYPSVAGLDEWYYEVGYAGVYL